MGNRILKDTIRINRRIDALSYFEEVVFYRLITAADDFGVYSANPVMLARTLFPLRESVDGKTMAEALKHLEDVGLVRCYSVKDEGDWLQIVSWGKHQRLRNSRRMIMPRCTRGWMWTVNCAGCGNGACPTGRKEKAGTISGGLLTDGFPGNRNGAARRGCSR